MCALKAIHIYMRSPFGTLSIMYGIEAALYFCMPNDKTKRKEKVTCKTKIANIDNKVI